MSLLVMNFSYNIIEPIITYQVTVEDKYWTPDLLQAVCPLSTGEGIDKDFAETNIAGPQLL